MEIVIIGCYDWIGFHLANKLVEEGISIIGVDNSESEKADTMSLFFGRNAAFSHYKSENEILKRKRSPDAIFIIHQSVSDEWLESFKDIPIITCIKKNSSIEPTVGTMIILPDLYGPWMPTNGKDCKIISKQIPESSIYIEDFTNWLKQLVNVADLPKQIDFSVLDSEKRDENEVLPNFDKRTKKEDGINYLLEHITKFPQFYD